LLQGKRYWCIAFAATDPWERFPTTAPPEEKYKALKEALQKDGPCTPSKLATDVYFSSENLTVSSPSPFLHEIYPMYFGR
jgi:hypothetical protein